MSVLLPDGHMAQPERTGLVVFDALERARKAFEGSGALDTIVGLMAACREAGVPIFHSRADHRADGMDFEGCHGDTDSSFRPWGQDNPPPDRPKAGSGSPKLAVLSEIEVAPEDYDVPKHRWSAFHGTHLELSLRSRGIDTVLLVGGSTHVGIAATAYAGRDMDFHMVIVRDGCTGTQEQREIFMEHVFPRMCHVLTAAEAINALKA